MRARPIEQEEHDWAAQSKVRDCPTLALAEPHGPWWDGVSIAHGVERIMTLSGDGVRTTG
jgi:hypothetical protein